MKLNMRNSNSLTTADISASHTLSSSIGTDVSIGSSEFMPMNTMGLGSFLSHETIAVPDILNMAMQSEMASPDTVFDFAEMADFGFFGNRFAPSETMCISGLRITSRGSVTTPKVTITSRADSSSPQMAVPEFGMEWRNWPVFIDVSPEPFFGWESYVDTWHTHDYTLMVTS